MSKKRDRDEPLSGLFAINKPTGMVSMKVLELLKPLLASSSRFANPDSEPPRKKRRGKSQASDCVKLGQGGTLDPLATGVLVIGVNKGTKSLQSYLTGEKAHFSPLSYRRALKADSLDAEGSVVYTKTWQHVTKEKIEEVLDKFRGDIQQTPPAYSAIQVDGKRLYEYARSGTPLPRPVERRKCHVSSLTLERFYNPDEHTFAFPSKRLTGQELDTHQKLIGMLGKTTTDLSMDTENGPTAAFELRMAVSGGTYVRTLVDDIARELDSAAFVAELERTKQGPFELKDCVAWEVFERAVTQSDGQSVDAPAWEGALLEKFVRV